MQFHDLKTPCFIFSEEEFERGIKGFRNALESYFNDVQIGYSVKTNSLTYAIKKANQMHCMAEVVSHDEYQLARLCGFEPSEIIYNGSMKSKETFLEAVICGGVVNIETKRELGWLQELPENSDNTKYNIGLRLNINISHVSPEDADGEDDNSRFGFSDEVDEFLQAVEVIKNIPNVKLAGLHVHRTTHSRAPRFYKKSIEYAASIIKKYGLTLDYLDIGGGYFGIFPNKPTFEDYVNSFYSSLKENSLENLRIVIEPGNALTASSFDFLSEVIDVKKVDASTRFVTIDGSRNDIDPFFRKMDYIKEVLPKTSNKVVEPLQIVAGCTCLEYDRLFSLLNTPSLQVGDRIIFHNVGAYTMTLSPQFIRFWPRVYVKDKRASYQEVRQETTASDIINLNN